MERSIVATSLRAAIFACALIGHLAHGNAEPVGKDECARSMRAWAQSHVAALPHGMPEEKPRLRALLSNFHIPRTGARVYQQCFLKSVYKPSDWCPTAMDPQSLNPKSPACRLMWTRDDYSLIAQLPPGTASLVLNLRRPEDRVASAYAFAATIAAASTQSPAYGKRRLLRRQRRRRKLLEAGGAAAAPPRVPAIWPWGELVAILEEGATNSTDIHNSVVPFEDFVKHPSVAPLLYNGATMQLAGLTPRSRDNNAPYLRACIAAHPELGEHALDVAKARLEDAFHVGLVEARNSSAELLAAQLAYELANPSSTNLRAAPAENSSSTSPPRLRTTDGAELLQHFFHCQEQMSARTAEHRKSVMAALLPGQSAEGAPAVTAAAAEYLKERNQLDARLYDFGAQIFRRKAETFRVQVEEAAAVSPPPPRQLCGDPQPPYTGPRHVWRPRAEKYLVALCSSGQLSDRMACIQHALQAAALLNRTMIMPEEDMRPTVGGPYNFDLVFDIAHARHCLGLGTVMSLSEFFQAHPGEGRPLKVEKLHCWRKDCNQMDWSRVSTISLPATPGGASFPENPTVSQFLEAFSSDVRILSIGDTAGVGITGAPELHKLALQDAGGENVCRVLMKPHNGVLRAARAFVREVLGHEYLALHLRRNDFQLHFNESTQAGGRLPPQTLVRCVREKMAALGVRLLFLATNAEPAEAAAFGAMLEQDAPPAGRPTIVRLPPVRGSSWGKELDSLGLAESELAVAQVEKVVAAVAPAFLSQRGSAFSRHVAEYRRAFGVPTCNDKDVCAP